MLIEAPASPVLAVVPVGLPISVVTEISPMVVLTCSVDLGIVTVTVGAQLPLESGGVAFPVHLSALGGSLTTRPYPEEALLATRGICKRYGLDHVVESLW